ncbi:electron transport complex protein RnfB [Noviherbaspirillum humi]|uniref:Electron transport complex protein RnfB n=1 Tax=Noviherbaspirillum humi TaxID=1688639 RepID=A0A239GHE4_9BURK|nr:electron transport complex protein RnfB [Noviherbaspirillum humi]
MSALQAPSLADQIEDLLPQTQCTKCGYPACRPYAEAVAAGQAGYNQCPPGGMEGVTRLSALLGKPVIPLNPVNGIERPRPLAVIDEVRCIGCTLCIQACPVDAIVGAAKQMHTVVPQFCTGCDLCVAPCPVDCIDMVEATPGQTGWAAWSQQQADEARARHALRVRRLRREKEENDARLAAKAAAKLRQVEAEVAMSPEEQAAQARKRAIIQAAMERARQRQQEAARQPSSPTTDMQDVSRAVRRQVEAIRENMAQQDKPT